jgi:hypothetical protein
MRINPTNQPRLRASNPRIHGKWPKASGLTQIVKKLGGPPAPSWSRKTTTPVGEKRETKLPNKRKNAESQEKDHTTLPSGGVGSCPGATRFNILSKQALNVKITEISENVSELIPVVHLPLPITGGVGTRNGVTNDKMMEFFEKAKDTVKEIINGFNAGSKRLEILNQYILKKPPCRNYTQVTRFLWESSIGDLLFR